MRTSNQNNVRIDDLPKKVLEPCLKIPLKFIRNFFPSGSLETPKVPEDCNVINANPTLPPRKAHSIEVVGKWTQIVRQQNVEQENHMEPKLSILLGRV